MQPPDTRGENASPGSPSEDGARHRTERRTVWRGTLFGVSLVALVTLAVLLIGQGYDGYGTTANPAALRTLPTPAPTWSTATLPGKVKSLAGGAWAQVQPPSAVGRVAWFTPSPVDANEAFLCGSESSGADAIWATYDGGTTWARMPLPMVGGSTACLISSNVAQPHTFVATLVDTHTCAPPTIALTSDDGHTWTTLTSLPVAPHLSRCWDDVSIAGHALYLSYVDFYYSQNVSNNGSTPTPQPTQYYYSPDLGQTWTRTNTAGENISGLAGLALTNGEWVSVAPTTPTAQTATLLTSEDGGQSWTRHGTISTLYPQSLFAAPGATVATLLSRDNLLYGLSEVQITSLLYRTRIAARQADGNWTLLPPLPVPGTSPDRMGIAQVLAETPSGQLLALGTSPNAPLPDASATTLPENSQQWFWLWNPAQQRWSAVGSPLDVAWRVGVLMWQGTLVPTTPQGTSGTSMTLWLTHWSEPDASGISDLSIYREALSQPLS